MVSPAATTTESTVPTVPTSVKPGSMFAHALVAAVGAQLNPVTAAPFFLTTKMDPPVPRKFAVLETRRLATVPAVVAVQRKSSVVEPLQTTVLEMYSVSAEPTVPEQRN